MTWFKVDDGFYDHPKADAAGTSALGLWVRCGSYSAKQLTDGFVPKSIAQRYGSAAMIRALVAAGLWDQVDGGYQFHEWHQSNPSREQVAAEREASRQRVKRWRDTHPGNGVTPPVTPGSGNGVTHGVGNGVSNAPPDPTRPSTEPLVQTASKPQTANANVIPYENPRLDLARQVNSPSTWERRPKKQVRESTSDVEWAHHMQMVKDLQRDEETG